MPALAEAELAEEAAARHVRRAGAADGVRRRRQRIGRPPRCTAAADARMRLAVAQVWPHVERDGDAGAVAPEAVNRLL